LIAFIIVAIFGFALLGAIGTIIGTILGGLLMLVISPFIVIPAFLNSMKGQRCMFKTNRDIRIKNTYCVIPDVFVDIPAGSILEKYSQSGGGWWVSPSAIDSFSKHDATYHGFLIAEGDVDFCYGIEHRGYIKKFCILDSGVPHKYIMFPYLTLEEFLNLSGANKDKTCNLSGSDLKIINKKLDSV